MVIAFLPSFGRQLRAREIPDSSARNHKNLPRIGSVRVVRWQPATCKASKGKPQEQVVKSSYYKNPSRAIERGGGFYIPGLRGPRLRFFVGGAVLLSLILNASSGFSSGSILRGTSAAISSFGVSSALAVIASMYVLVTAFQDVSKSAPKGSEPRLHKLSQDISGSSEDAILEYEPKQDAGSLFPDVQWVVDVVSDMMSADAEIWIFRRQGEPLCLFAKDRAVNSRLPQVDFTGGPVVERVGTESRVLYVDDSSTLPNGIGFPFLSDVGIWSVFLVPLVRAKCVFVVALPKRNAQSNTMTLEDRRWIEALADKVNETLV